MRSTLWSLFAAVWFAAVVPGGAAPIRVMLLDGESGGPYHDWRTTTGVLKQELGETGLFQVDVVTAPPPGASFSGFKPTFTMYQAVVLNYDAPDERWPADLRTAFEQYMNNGGGLVIVHAADNSFPGWKAFNEMIGVGGWRDRTEAAGPFWYVKDGTLTSDNTPGRAGSHGQRLPFKVRVREPRHPITAGLPDTWMHAGDELYARLRGPGRNMQVLATAYSDPSNSGSGHDEPQLMALMYGKGRVFHTTLGHDVEALRSVDFIVTLQRGTEWAATGRVTQQVPADFPTADTIRTRAALAPTSRALTLAWAFQTGQTQQIKASPILVDGMIYVTTRATTVWHAGIGRVGNSPVTYELDGRQYMLIGGGSALYAWTLPDRRPSSAAAAGNP